MLGLGPTGCRVLGLGAVGFRGSWFRVLCLSPNVVGGIQGLGLRALGFWALGFRVLGLRL